MQEVVYFQLDEVAYVFVDCHAAGSHVGRSQFRFGLAFEDRLFHIDGDGGNQSVTDVGIVHVLVEELFDGTGDMFFESTLMGTPLCGVLTVDEGVIFFSVLSGVSEGDFDVFSFQVDDGIEAGCRHVVVQQVYQTVARQDAVTVVNDGESRVEVRIVTQHGLDKFGLEAVVDEQRIVRFEEDKGSVVLFGVLRHVGLQVSFGECGDTHFTVTVAAYFKTRAQCVDGFHTDTVQSDAFLKCLAVVFTTRVQYAYGFYQFSLGDASSVVAYADAEVLFNGNFDFLTGLHLELVDTVVNDFFEEDIDSVFGVRAIAQPTDVHTGACAHMFHVAQVADVVVSVLYCIVVVYRYQFVLFHSCYLISLVNARRRLCCLVSK